MPGYTLAMSQEIRDWLADLGRAERPAAEQVGGALIALLTGGDSVGSPLVTSVVPGADRSGSPADRATEALDLRADELLEQTSQARRRLAAVAETGDRDAELAELVLRAQRRAEAFRVRRSVLTARYAAAQAELAVAEAELAGQDAGADAADPGAAVGTARQNLAGVLADMEQAAGGNDRGRELLQIRPGGAADGIRIIFAVEPAGTALLIAVVETPDGQDADLAPAIDVSASVLAAVRDGSDSDALAITFASPRPVLDLLALD